MMSTPNMFRHQIKTIRYLVGNTAECYRSPFTVSQYKKIRSRSIYCPRSPQYLFNSIHVDRISCFSTAQTQVEDETDTTTVSKESHSSARMEPRDGRKLSQVLISEVLQAKNSYRWVEPVIPRNATIKDAIEATIDGGLSGMMVVETDGADVHKRVVGLVTSRDLLRILASGIKDGLSNDQLLDHRVVGDFMTPISQVIFARPDETIGMCRAIMAKLGIKCLPVLSRQGKVEGILTAKDMADFGLSAKDKGGKQAYLNDISERVGLSSSTSMAEPPTYLKAQIAFEHNPLYVNIGISALPHPFKTISGESQRDVRNSEYGSDLDLSEDAKFSTTVYFPDGADRKLRQYTYVGVSDGVGSWREYGVDPRKFSRMLMSQCENILMEASHASNNDSEVDKETRRFRHVISAAELMSQAYNRVKEQNIIGSATACIGLLDGYRHQLHFSNLGDSGLVILRHIDSEIAGSLKRDRTKPRMERESDIRVAFVSQQQLRSFNHPYQLGWTGEELKEGESSSFKRANDACSTSVHIRRGDIIIMATDGLFDNVEVDDIAAICLDWEQRNGFIRGGDTAARERRWEMGNSLSLLSMERIGDLSAELCQKARLNSLNNELDSPFAILAKENDIMWSGGMPDDCTVVAIHVTGKDSMDMMGTIHQ